MRINFHGRLVDEPQVRAGFIGCGSHAFRNVYPALQFAPVELVATCDLDLDRAQAFARRFGAQRAYADYREMLAREKLDATFVVLGYDESGRPLYPRVVTDCLRAGCHVWMEKPPAATCADLAAVQAAAEAAGKHVVVGFKKMFAPANGKARELISTPGFGTPSVVLLQYPQYVPTVDELHRYLDRRENVGPVVGFLDHLCHPVSLLVLLLGMPQTLYYERSTTGGGLATFGFAAGTIASLALTWRCGHTGGFERTTIASDTGRHIVVDNNIRVGYFQTPPPVPGTGYGSNPDFFTGGLSEAATWWEPEFSLGQLYNKGLFLLGYYNEVNEFARAILDGCPPAKGTLAQAAQVTRIFEAFAEGPGRPIWLSSGA